jgi:hypothetical protein
VEGQGGTDGIQRQKSCPVRQRRREKEKVKKDRARSEKESELLMAKKRSGGSFNPMVGMNVPTAVKQPVKTPNALKGTKAGKSNPKGSKTLKMADGVTSGIMRPPRG